MDPGSGPIRTAWRGIGLLFVLAVLAMAIAAYIHHVSVLPSAYTWLEPLRTLRNIAGDPWSPTVIVGAFLIGRLRWRGTWSLDWLRSSEQLELRAIARTSRAKRIAVLAVVLLVTGALVFPHHNPFDRIALVVMAFIIGWPQHERHLGRLVAEIAFATFVFLSICYCFTVLKALTFVDRTQVDLSIVELEKSITGVYPHRVITAWSADKKWLIELCDWAYFKLFLHMALTTSLLLGMHRSRERVEYLGALALCYLLGGPLYHLFPAAGPVYFDPASYRHVFEMPLLTNGIRDWLYQNTGGVVTKHAVELKTWGYIACMPSLHIAHEIVMLWYSRRSRLALLLSSAFTAITCLAVVVLGWHYPIDLVGGIVVAGIAIGIARWQRDALFPARVMPRPDPELPPRPSVRAFLAKLSASRARGG